MKKFRRKYWLVSGLVVFHLVVNLLWLVVDNSPPAWDSAFHIKQALEWRDWLIGKTGLVEAIKLGYGYPPLVYGMTAIWSFLVGKNIDGLVLVNSLFLGMAVLGVYQVSGLVFKKRRWRNWSVVIFSFLPVVYAVSREMLLDMPLLAVVTWGLYFFVKSENFLKFEESGWFLVCMVAASLTKLNGMIYFVPLWLIVLGKVIKDKDVKRLRNMVVMGLAWVGLVGWWWVINVENIVNYLTGLAGRGEVATDPMNLLSFWTWWHYFKLFVVSQATVIPALILVVLVAMGIKRKKKDNFSILLWFGMANYVMFTIIKNKDMRFTMPILPVVVMMAVEGARRLRMASKNVFGGLMVILMTYSLFFYIDNSFGWPIRKEYRLSSKSFLFEWLDWINISDYPVAEAKKGNWPNRQIVSDMQKLGVEEGRLLRVAVVIDRQEINYNNLNMYQRMSDLPKMFEIEPFLGKSLADYDLVLVADRDMEIAPFYMVNLLGYERARDWMWQNWGRFEVRGEYQIYGDKRLYLLAVRK